MKAVKSKHVVEFLGVPYATFHLWTKRGLLGPRFIAKGQGDVREFGFKELVILRVVQRFLSVVKDIEFAKQVAADLDRAWNTHDFELMPIMVITILDGNLYISWIKPELGFSEELIKKGIVTLISVKNIRDEAVRFLGGVGIEKQPALIK